MVCPSAIETTSIGGQPVTIDYTAPTASGGVAPVSVTCAPASGTLFPAGGTPVSCTATDAIGQRAACGFAVGVTPVPRLLQTRFMTFGDSLTAGTLSTLTLLVESPAHSYPGKLVTLLNERYAGQPVTVLNEGSAGERADQSFGRFRAALSTHRPGAVLLMHGVNDLNGGPERVQSTADAVEELTKESVRSGIVTYLATLPPLGPGRRAGCPECVEPYNVRIRHLAATKGAVLVDVHAAWRGGTGLMGPDGIHPTVEGYEVIARAFLDAIQRTLEAPAGSQ